MPKIQMVVELDYEEYIMNPDEPEEVDWFVNDILFGDGKLMLHSNEIGDTIGTIKVLQLQQQQQEKNFEPKRIFRSDD